MIQFADEHTTPIVRQMWKTCFGDTDQFLDIYFRYKYKPENTLIYFEEGEAVASLQMLPYTITFYEHEIPFAYLAGLCTLPEYRNRGFMGQLICEAHKIIIQRNIPLAILIPAEDWLYGFYEKYGYVKVFERDDNPIPIKDIIETYPDEKEAYQEFDSLFRPLDFCVQKKETDFKAIIEDYFAEGCPVKTNLSGMARITDVWTLLSLYAKNNLSQKFRIKIINNFSNKSFLYYVNKGKVELILGTNIGFDIEVDFTLLCRLLFGFKLEEINNTYLSFFRSHYPIMNLMLE